MEAAARVPRWPTGLVFVGRSQRRHAGHLDAVLGDVEQLGIRSICPLSRRGEGLGIDDHPRRGPLTGRAMARCASDLVVAVAALRKLAIAQVDAGGICTCRACARTERSIVVFSSQRTGGVCWSVPATLITPLYNVREQQRCRQAQGADARQDLLDA